MTQYGYIVQDYLIESDLRLFEIATITTTKFVLESPK